MVRKLKPTARNRPAREEKRSARKVSARDNPAIALSPDGDSGDEARRSIAPSWEIHLSQEQIEAAAKEALQAAYHDIGPASSGPVTDPEDVATAANKLILALRRCAEGAGSFEVGVQRNAAVNTLAIVEMFIQSLWPEWRDLSTLTPLIDALRALDRGNVDPILERTKVGHRRRDNIGRRMIKCAVAVTVTMLENELPPERMMAAKYVADLLHRCGFELNRREKVTRETVNEWRYEWQRVRNRERFQAMLANAQNNFDKRKQRLETRSARRDYLLSELLKIVASFSSLTGASTDAIYEAARSFNAPWATAGH